MGTMSSIMIQNLHRPPTYLAISHSFSCLDSDISFFLFHPRYLSPNIIRNINRYTYIYKNMHTQYSLAAEIFVFPSHIIRVPLPLKLW